MIVVLKVILSLLSIAVGVIARFVFKDFRNVLKTEGFDEITVWQKLKFMSTFVMIMTGLASLITFLLYFVIAPLQIL